MYEWGTNSGAKNDLTVDPEYTSRVELDYLILKESDLYLDTMI